jgi:hypothetical protein
VTFPAGVLTIQVTGLDLSTLDGTPLNGVVIFTPSAPLKIAGKAVLEGSASAQVSNGVMTPVTIPCTDNTAPAFTYTIAVRLQGPDNDPPPTVGVAIPHTLGSTVDVSSLL